MHKIWCQKTPTVIPSVQHLRANIGCFSSLVTSRPPPAFERVGPQRESRAKDPTPVGRITHNPQRVVSFSSHRQETAKYGISYAHFILKSTSFFSFQVVNGEVSRGSLSRDTVSETFSTVPRRGLNFESSLFVLFLWVFWFLVNLNFES